MSARPVRLRMVQPEHQYESPLCAPCGGSCCKRMPGTTHPSQWGETEDEMVANLASAFASGMWAVDWWDGDPRPDAPSPFDANGDWFDNPARLDRAEYVRPAMGSPHRFPVEHPAWGHDGPCVFLADAGCKLTHDERPLGCRALEPGEPECKPHDGGKAGGALVWVPFRSVIARALVLAREYSA